MGWEFIPDLSGIQIPTICSGFSRLYLSSVFHTRLLHTWWPIKFINIDSTQYRTGVLLVNFFIASSLLIMLRTGVKGCIIICNESLRIQKSVY